MSNTLFQVLRTATGWKLQFSGTVDVTQEQQQAILDSGLAIMLIAARTGKAEVDFKENGDTGLKVTLRVSDSALLGGKTRDDAITYLAHGPDQGALDFGNYNYAGELNGGPPPPSAESEPVAERSFDDEDGSYIGDGGPPLDDDIDTGDSVVVGHVGDYRENAVPGEARGGDGPRVGKFSPDMGPSAPAGTQRVGSVYGHDRKDKVLADFMAEEHPHGGG